MEKMALRHKSTLSKLLIADYAKGTLFDLMTLYCSRNVLFSWSCSLFSRLRLRCIFESFRQRYGYTSVCSRCILYVD